jgi:hypothetical protein
MFKDEECINDKICEGDLISDAEIDARLALLDVHYANALGELKKSFSSARQYLSKQRRTRLSRAMVVADGDGTEGNDSATWTQQPLADAQASHATGTRTNGYYIRRKVFDLPDGEVEEEIDGGEGCGKTNPSPAESLDFSAEIAPDLLARALDSAAVGVPVLPVWSVADGICDCHLGSECRSAGKHPHSKFAPRGVHSATTNGETIRAWFKRNPRINYGEAMGGALNLVCVDLDPRNDGDLSYHDLIEAHGDDAFPPTREKPTGGDGWHKLYKLRGSIKSAKGETKGKLAPGIDVKGAGGLIVGAGCAHASGKRYGDYNDAEIAYAPEWMESAIRKIVAGSEPEKVIDFQAYRERPPLPAGGRYFGVGKETTGFVTWL